MYIPLAALCALVIIGGYRTAMCFASRKEMVDDRANREAMETNRGPAIAIALFTIGIAVLFGMLSARRLTAYADPVVLWQDAGLPTSPTITSCTRIWGPN